MAISLAATFAFWLGLDDVYRLKHHGEELRGVSAARVSTVLRHHENAQHGDPTVLRTSTANTAIPAQSPRSPPLTLVGPSVAPHSVLFSTSIALQSNGSTNAATGLTKPPYFDRGIYNTIHGEKYYDISRFDGLLPEGNWTLLLPVLKKLASGGDLKIFVLGGSFTSGVDCLQPAKGTNVSRRLCAWPSRFLHWLRAAFPRSSVQMENHAQGGSPSNVILAGLGLLNFAGVDLVLVETLVNDWGDEVRAYERNSRINKEVAVSASFEVLLRTLKKVAPRSLIYTVEAACPGCRLAITNHKKVLEFYKIPHMDMVKVVKDAPTLWNGRNHPSYQTHQALADLLALSWSNVSLLRKSLLEFCIVSNRDPSYFINFAQALNIRSRPLFKGPKFKAL